eukprot:4210350-Lingulodinium_polyedra.AAC.1
MRLGLVGPSQFWAARSGLRLLEAVALWHARNPRPTSSALAGCGVLHLVEEGPEQGRRATAACVNGAARACEAAAAVGPSGVEAPRRGPSHDQRGACLLYTSPSPRDA